MKFKVGDEVLAYSESAIAPSFGTIYAMNLDMIYVEWEFFWSIGRGVYTQQSAETKLLLVKDLSNLELMIYDINKPNKETL
jgi:hypothetical protein